MRQKMILAGAATLILAAAAISSFAGDRIEPLLGEPEAPAAATRTVVINSDTAYVNVTHGDIVDFIVDGRAFAWEFDGAVSLSEINLAQIEPSGMAKHNVRIYIARNHHADYGS